MANVNFIASSAPYGWAQSLSASGKYPLISKRLWETYADMMEFVGDTNDTCVSGVILTVVNDTDSKKNGAYFVASCPTLDNPELPVKVEKIGTGETLTAETYAAAKALATADLLGSLIYVRTDSDEGNKGFYIVAGEKSIQKLGTVNAVGDLSGDVENIKTVLGDESTGLVKDVNDLQEAVSSIEVPVKDVTVDGVSVLDENGVAVIELPEVDFTDVYAAIDNKVAKNGTDRLMTVAEGEKLAAIAEGAQVNVIEKIKFNGTVVEVDAQTKMVELNTPADIVRGLADGEKVLSLDAESGKLGTTLGLTYVNEGDVCEIQLVGKNNEVLGRVDAKEFVEDGMLSSVELLANPEGHAEGTYLVFTWNTESGLTDPMYVPVTDLIDVYTAGNGIALDGKVITAKVKANDPYIEVTTEGIASKGIDNAILVAKNAVIGTTDDVETDVTLYGVKKYAANLVGAHESTVTVALGNKADKDAFDQFVQSTNDTLSGIKVTDVNTTESAGVKLTKSEKGVIGVSVDAANLGAALVGAPGTVGSVAGTTVKLGQAITDGAEENPVEIISATTSVHAAIQTLAGQIQAAVAGGITAIDGGEYIAVGGTATSKTLSLNVAKIGEYLVDNSSAIKADKDGKLTLEWENVE